MKCISVYTGDFGAFSDIYEQVMQTTLADNEETEIEGITVAEAGEVTSEYVDRMKERLDVVVMKQKEHGVTILQHGSVFEIIIPETSPVASM
ncbi:NAD/NADP transhydrogenase alpha subunit [Paenibacillus albiflavus]|uniref:NAD/NADP transhydrogenase alpha subunit n=1 Tax=Paenibacillus albiflavus TaxID=2545760 RepID=A0A4R4ENW4_9BACL|nr:NAD/NADP transhydrogenase alpha subunit [Paenibacillus albiflavus]TCZ81150.1 NAD/NADP transhydrogenase alpha subunit [Paenibacillus albiflavus]